MTSRKYNSLLEDPEMVVCGKTVLKFNDSSAITFGLASGTVYCAMYKDAPPEWDEHCEVLSGLMTHYKLSAMYLHNMDQEAPYDDNEDKDLPSVHDFEVPGRAWTFKAYNSERLLVSFWWKMPDQEDIDKIVQALIKYLGKEPEGGVWIEIDWERWQQWQPDDIQTLQDPDEGTLARIKKLSALLHVATPEEKARIRAEIAQARKEAGQPEPDELHGDKRAARAAAAAGEQSIASFNAKRRQEGITPRKYNLLLEENKTLFIVHVEEAFRRFYNKTYLMRLRSLVMRSTYGRVVFLNSNVDDIGRMAELQDLRGEDWDWGWGYEPDMFEGDEEEQKWVIEAPNSAHEYTWVPPEMRGITQARLGEVSVMGGHGDECLADWEAVLQHCGIAYRRLEGLIYT